jgi:hypothetical protein
VERINQEDCSVKSKNLLTALLELNSIIFENTGSSERFEQTIFHITGNFPYLPNKVDENS